ncbi:MAG: sensor histidine kinase [Steroidobacter sp.]
MWPVTTFRTNAMAGGAIVILLLATGMWLSIRGFDAVATAQLTHIRAQEQEITFAERLRWSGELVVSVGRGYLLSRDPALHARLLRVRSEFDRGVVALRTDTLSPRSAVLVAGIERDARNFVRIQEELIAARERPGDVSELVLRFENELVPLQRKLGQSLDRLVDSRGAALADIYIQAERQRDRLAVWMYSLLVMLILLGFLITSHFARQIASAYRKEQDALEIARKAVRARDDLMSIVAHDLRNPLLAIAVKAELLQRLTESDKVREQAESIANVTQRMEYLIKSMLDVTSMEAGRFSVTPAPCDVDHVIRESIEMFDALATARQIRLVQRVNATGLGIRADRERVLQLLSNLLGNALKFAPQGSEVTIAAERRHEMVRFTVCDSGHGIRAENLRRVFDRFWKRDIEGRNGTGLGLFIAKGIVEAHGGQIWVESEPGRGATFHFTLPTIDLDRAGVLKGELRQGDAGFPISAPVAG